MERKNIILIIVSVILFAAAGYVLYTGVFSRTVDVLSSETSTVPNAQQLSTPLLPYGHTLDFGPIEKRQDTGAPYAYELLNSQTDVGVGINELIRNNVQALPPGVPQQLTRPVDGSDRLLQNR